MLGTLEMITLAPTYSSNAPRWISEINGLRQVLRISFLRAPVFDTYELQDVCGSGSYGKYYSEAGSC
jgi:hypothetical protein